MSRLSYLLVALGAIVLISNQNLVDARATNGMSMPIPSSITIPIFKVPRLGRNGNAGAGGGTGAGGGASAGGGSGTGGGMGGGLGGGMAGGTGGSTGTGFGMQIPIPTFNMGG